VDAGGPFGQLSPDGVVLGVVVVVLGVVVVVVVVVAVACWLAA
jgi:hypothetical protein